MLADLSRYPLAEVIRRLSAAQQSGDLEVRDGRVVKTVYFDRGRVVFAASNQDEDRLGDILLSIGRITPEDFERVSKLMKSGSKPLRFGDALVLAGLMDRNELGRSLARQVRSVVRSLFGLDSGAASFAERKPTVPLEYMVGVSVHRMLYAGIRNMHDARLLRLGLGDLGRRVRRVEVPPFRFATYKCPREELEMLERCRQPTRLRDLVAVGQRASSSRLKIAYALYASGLIEDADPYAKAIHPVPHPETGTFLLSVAEPSPPSRTEAVRLEVKQELEFSGQIDPAAWARASNPAEVEQALQDKLERLCGLHESVASDPELLRDLEIVLGRTASALHRARRLSTSKAAMSQMEGAAAAEPRGPAAADGGPTIPPSEPAIALPPPPEEPAPPAAPTQTTLPPITVPPEKAPHPSPEADRRVQQLLATAELRLKVRNTAGAVEALRELVAHAPGVAEYRLRLARAMSDWVPTLRQAEREYLQAIRLEPKSAQAHYEFALFYERLKFRGRALAELRTALQLVPAHAEARALLERIAPREAAQTNPGGSGN